MQEKNLIAQALLSTSKNQEKIDNPLKSLMNER